MIAESEVISKRPELSAEKRALLEKRLRGIREGRAKRAGIPRRGDRANAPLSFAQEQLWFLDQLSPDSALYNISAAVRLSGRLDRAALEKSLAAIVARHEALRTTFHTVEGSPVQVIGAPAPVRLTTVDLTAIPVTAREDEMVRRLREEAQRPFDLSRDLMLRAALFRLDEAEHVLSVTAHHIASDGWSLGIFFRELAAFYEPFGADRAPTLPELPIQFADFATWQRERMPGRVHEKQLAFWKEELANAPVLLELPTDRPRPRVQSFRGACETLALPRELSERIKALARREGVTLFMLLLAGFKVLLHRYTRQTDITVGTPVAGRNQIETEALIGFFINTLVLRTRLSGELTFRELLQRVRGVALDALAHQELPFEKLVEELRSERSLGHNPLFQVMFVLQSAPMRPVALAGLTLTPMVVDTATAKFDLTLSVEEYESGLATTLEYRTDLFERETSRRMLGHFQTLLEGIVADPQQKISRLPLLTETERRQLLAGWNDTTMAYPRDKTMAQLFEEQAGQRPDAVAVDGPRLWSQTQPQRAEGEAGAAAGAPHTAALRSGEQQLTYRELNERANQVAHHLQKLGIGPDVVVAVCLERSLELIVALLGILKAGGAYASLDPSHPPERLAFMLADARSPMMLTQEKLRPKCQAAAAAAPFQIENRKSKTVNPVLVCLDTGWEAIARESLANPAGGVTAGNLAYVSYTSGSTGRPKGVCVPHRGVVRLVKNTNFARFGPDEILLQLAPVAFDASTLEIWGALLNGAKLMVFPPGTPSLSELGAFIAKHRVTTLWLTAGLFHQMVEEQLESLRGVRQLLAGGDVLSVPHVRKALEGLPGCQLINGYGPTENTTFTCCHPMRGPLPDDRSIPIGRPIANTQVFVLDDHLQPVPIGVPGELCVGGDGLARGYLNAPELTAEKFVPNPFPDDKERGQPCPRESNREVETGDVPEIVVARTQRSALLYRTGDLVRWRPDGSLEFLGRLDQQVKIRGFRVEVGEIEATLSQHPGVLECAVTVHADAHGEKTLAAFVVAMETPAPTPADLRAFLQEKLPDPMIPSAFLFLDALPLNVNGKVDRWALRAPEMPRLAPEKGFVAPGDEVERQLQTIWQEILGIQPVGVKDKFFELGGHSLLAVRLVARMEKTFGKKLAVAAVFQCPTIAQLAGMLRNGDPTEAGSAVVEIQGSGSQPPLFLVHGVGGGMFWGYTNLCRHLGGDQPVFALKSRGMEGLEEFASIGEMAAHYVAELRAVQPRGPYYLGGYCFGGNVAYEMARRLHAQGERVALLAVMNGAPPNSGYARIRWTPAFVLKFLRNLCGWATYFTQWSPKQRRDFFRWKARSLKKKLTRRFNSFRTQPALAEVEELVDVSAYPPEQRRLWEIHIRALMNYYPQPYAGRVTLFRSRVHPVLCSFDPQCGWGSLAAGGVTVKIVPGAHESILEEPHVRALAEELKKSLREVAAQELEVAR